jgi:long-chain acyl-CoA synthetase
MSVGVATGATRTGTASATACTAGGAEPDVGHAPLLVAQLRHWARVRPDALAWAVYPTGQHRPLRTLTWAEWAQAVDNVSAALRRDGIAPGDRVAIFAGNRLLWPVLDLALQQLRAVGVGIYPTSTVVQVGQLLEDCAPALVVADTAARCALVQEAAHRLAAPVRLLADDPVPGVELLAPWCAAGAEALARDPALAAAVRQRAEQVAPDDLAALIYTSGSTGVPKGVMISHRCLAASAASVTAVLGLGPDDRGLSFLPFSHAAERMFGQGTRLAAGIATALVEDPADLFPVCAHFEPTVVGGLPRIFERVYERTEVARRAGGDARGALAALLGARVRLATSGGAPLPARVAEALAALGCPIVGAYGQTEHLCVAMNRPEAPRVDVVGPPMPGTTVRVADDGELLVRRSALTFSGYWGRPDETAAAFTADGTWLRTGDRAEVAPDGALRITGRIKELIALSTGRKVAPLPIEGALADTPFIAHAVCHGEGRKHLVALLALRRPVVEAWARERALSLPWATLVQHPALQAQLATAVEAVNAGLPRTDRVVAWTVTDAEWTVDGGELTPTLKVRRAAVESRHAALLASLYDSNPSAA